MKDRLGVEIEVGDVVRFTAYGYGVLLTDVGQTATVTGFGRTRVVTDHETSHHPRHDEIAVVRRDGAEGLEGNK